MEEPAVLRGEIPRIERPLVHSGRRRGTGVAHRLAPGEGEGMGGGLGMRWGLVPALTAALLLSGAARAEDEEQATKLPRVYGRVLANTTADERSLYERQFNVTDARIGASAEPFDWLQTVLEVDASSHAPIKDAYGRFRDPSHRYRLYAGQFKTPFTARYEESNWELPLVNRGVSYDIPVDESGEWVLQPVAAAEGIRVPGAMMAYSGRAGMNLLIGDTFKVMLQGEHALRPQETWSGKALILAFGARF